MTILTGILLFALQAPGGPIFGRSEGGDPFEKLPEVISAMLPLAGFVMAAVVVMSVLNSSKRRVEATRREAAPRAAARAVPAPRRPSCEYCGTKLAGHDPASCPKCGAPA